MRARWLLVPLSWFAISCDGGPTTEPAKPSASVEERTAQPPRPSSAPSASSVPSPSATPSPTPEAALRSATAANAPILFELKKGDKTNFIFGTMHIGTDIERDINPVVLESFDRSTRAAFEIELDNISMMSAAKQMMLPPEKSAKDGLSEKQWRTLVDAAGSFLTPASSLERMKPWALSTLIMQKFLPSTQPMDLVLLKRARTQKKSVLFLETAEEQMSLLDQVFDTSALAEMLDDLDKAKRDTMNLAETYRSGDLPSFEKAAFDPVEMKKRPPMFDLLLFKRNDAWIPQLKTPFDDGGVFVAVGAAHVVGDRGIVKLLEREGFTVTRVQPLP